MSDIAEITNLINLYAVAVDAHRYEFFDEIFTDDISIDFGTGGASWPDLAALKQAFAIIHAPFAATQHITSGHAVRIYGDTAKCFSYVNGNFQRDGMHFQSNGWYDDALRRTPGGWRISKRSSRMVSITGDVRVMQVLEGVDTNYKMYALATEAGAGTIEFFK